MAGGSLPSPKALATLVVAADGDLILYGGFSKSSMNPIHQTTTFYNEAHRYRRAVNRWVELTTAELPRLAGHSASMLAAPVAPPAGAADDGRRRRPLFAERMLLFGGSMGDSYSADVYLIELRQQQLTVVAAATTATEHAPPSSPRERREWEASSASHGGGMPSRRAANEAVLWNHHIAWSTPAIPRCIPPTRVYRYSYSLIYD